MADLSFTPEQHEALLALIRQELLAIFKHAQARTGQSLVSTSDMIMGKAPVINYLIEAVEKRLKAS